MLAEVAGRIYDHAPQQNVAPLGSTTDHALMTDDEVVERLRAFKDLAQEWRAPSHGRRSSSDRAAVRSAINEQKACARQEIIEAGCFITVTVAPPAAIGGLVARNVDPFDMMFEGPYGMDMMRYVIDMVDQTVGHIKSNGRAKRTTPVVRADVTEGYAFVAMPMDRADPRLVDVLDAIKEAGKRCGVTAERIDEPQTNDRITDRILESLRRAEFVIADLTNARPNVYFEAGYAHGLGKVPIYIAREGTQLEFDLKDYPVIFFPNLKQLKDDLEARLRGLAAKRRAT